MAEKKDKSAVDESTPEAAVQEPVINESALEAVVQEPAKPVYIVLQLLIHDNEYYQQGDVVTDISAEQADALISYGVLAKS